MATERTKRIVELMRKEIDLRRAIKKDGLLIKEIEKMKAELKILEDSRYYIPAQYANGINSIENLIDVESHRDSHCYIDEDDVEMLVNNQVERWLYVQQKENKIDQLKEKIDEKEKMLRGASSMYDTSESMRMIHHEIMDLAKVRGIDNK
jgi:hypothetical protein